MLKSKVLRSSRFVVDFLREQDQNKFGWEVANKE